MSGALATVKVLLLRLAKNWPNKVAAVLIAFVVWLLITSNNTTTTQNSMFVPLIVEGVDENQVAVGLPTRVAVSVSGPSSRIDRLTPEMLRATLDLTEVNGAFEQPITVQTPQDVTVLTVDPAQVIGFLESVVTRPVPVQVALTGALPADATVAAVATPPAVSLTGRSQVLDSVQRVVVTAPAIGGGAGTPVALDAQGGPVDEIAFDPPTVIVAVTTRAVLETRTVAIDFVAPQAQGLVNATISSLTVEVAGPRQALEALTTVTATVEPPTGEVDPGRYTLPVRLALPDGVVPLTTPTAALQFAREPLQP
jgi:YbbR domain-containing protein